MITYPALEQGKYYHVFTRGNNREALFRDEFNYPYFLGKVRHHLLPVAGIVAYCLLKNHVHFLVRVRTTEEQWAWAAGHRPSLQARLAVAPLDPRGELSRLFNGYAKAINRYYGRTGSLFQKRFRRRPLESQTDLVAVVRYIHRNPHHHGITERFQEYPYSSFGEILTGSSSLVDVTDALRIFSDRETFLALHAGRERCEAECDHPALFDD